jgi:hypothetical protein
VASQFDEIKASLKGFTDEFRDVKKLIPSPDPTSSEPWEVSIAEMVRRTGKVPKLATKALGLFDRFGSVRITPDEIGFDGEEIPWDKVVELRTHEVSNLLTGRALEREVDRIRGYLPPIPGRKWVVNKVVGLTLNLVLAVSGDYAKQVADHVDGINSDGEGVDPESDRVVAEIVYKARFGRKKEVQGGLFAAAVMTGNRDVSKAMREGAGMRGIPVVATEDDHFDAALERGEALRARFGKLAEMANKLRDTMESDADPDDEADADAPGDADEATSAPSTPSDPSGDAEVAPAS